MARYIDADKFVEWQDNRQETDHYMGWDYVKQCLYDDYVKADVAPVIHAHWINHFDDLFPVESTVECSNCHEEQMTLLDDNYCPNCGAKMEVENG